MNEELDYAEMLEIPVETVTVKRKGKKHKGQVDLKDQLVEQVNDRMEETAEDADPAFAQSLAIERDIRPKKAGRARAILIGEFVAVCALCATIFLTNIFMSDSAINTFVRGLFQGAETAQADTRTYNDFKLSPVVNEFTETEIAVSDTGVLSFTAKCSVYAPCDGTVASVNGNAETGYSVEIKHSDSFSTIMSGLDSVYLARGEKVKSNLPLGYTDGEGEVRVMFYDNGTLINHCSVEGNTLSWS
ncbi:MAG: M23 family metallopeptidase [Clostridiales bacterium]|nr:M23 family metallopeptidase [Clostridiales bacterium]